MILFDLDGTLVDSAADIGRALSRTLTEDGLSAVTEDDTRRLIGDGARALVRRAWSSRGIELDPSGLDERVVAFREHYARAAVVRTRPYPGVRGVLARLAVAEVLGLCTNKPMRHTDLVLDALDLRRWFEVVVGGDTLDRRKPDPAPVRHALAAVGAEPARSVLVGDGAQDAEAARAAGVAFVAVTWGYGGADVWRRADAVAHEPAALLDLLPPLLRR